MDSLVTVHKLLRYVFNQFIILVCISVIDKVFRGDCPTRQVYEEGAQQIALSVVNGINCKCDDLSCDCFLVPHLCN